MCRHFSGSNWLRQGDIRNGSVRRDERVRRRLRNKLLPSEELLFGLDLTDLSES